MFRNEKDFEKITGMNTIEFARFVREKATKDIDKRLQTRKKP